MTPQEAAASRYASAPPIPLTEEEIKLALGKAHPGSVLLDWDPDKHPRGGNPENPGQFSHAPGPAEEPGAFLPLGPSALTPSQQALAERRRLLAEHRADRLMALSPEERERLKLAQQRVDSVKVQFGDEAHDVFVDDIRAATGRADALSLYDADTGEIVIDYRFASRPGAPIADAMRHELSHRRLDTAVADPGTAARMTRYAVDHHAELLEQGPVVTPYASYNWELARRAYRAAGQDFAAVRWEGHKAFAADETLAELYRTNRWQVAPAYRELDEIVRSAPGNVAKAESELWPRGYPDVTIYVDANGDPVPEEQAVLVYRFGAEGAAIDAGPLYAEAFGLERDWDPDKHPRGGDPANPGRFSEAPGGGGTPAEATKPAEPAVALSVYHGTAGQYVEAIKRDGLKVEPNQRAWDPSFYEGERGESVYVTRGAEDAKSWGMRQAEEQFRKSHSEHIDYAVVRFDLPKEFARQLVPDEELPESSLRYRGTIPSKYLAGYTIYRWPTGSIVAQGKAAPGMATIYVCVVCDAEAGKEWREELHPRDEGGRFTESDGGGDYANARPWAAIPLPPTLGGPSEQPSDDANYLKADGRYHVQGDLEAAVRLLGQGKDVVLEQPHELSTMLDKLAEIGKEIREGRGEKKVYDLCHVVVAGTNLFCTDTQGYPRVAMPQLAGFPASGSMAETLPRTGEGGVDATTLFIEHLNSEGTDTIRLTEDAGFLRPSQMELDGAKVAGIMKAYMAGTLEDVPLVVSKDNYIIDGHHRWAAKVALEYASSTKITQDVIRVNMGIVPLIHEARDFAAEVGIPQLQQGKFKSLLAVGCGCPSCEHARTKAAEWDPSKRPRKPGVSYLDKFNPLHRPAGSPGSTGGQFAPRDGGDATSSGGGGGKVTDTPEFKRWFGNSKVVDANGDPLVVYHGTTSQSLDKFDPEHAMAGNIQSATEHIPMYFATDKPEVANTYADREGGNVLPLYMSIEHPLIVDAHGEDFVYASGLISDRLITYRNAAAQDFAEYRDHLAARFDPAVWENSDLANLLSAHEYARLNDLRARADADKSEDWRVGGGVDGIIVKDVIDQAHFEAGTHFSTVYIAFRPDQIRSAITGKSRTPGITKFNPLHRPAGSPGSTGGQFAPRDEGDGGGGGRGDREERRSGCLTVHVAWRHCGRTESGQVGARRSVDALPR